MPQRSGIPQKFYPQNNPTKHLMSRMGFLAKGAKVLRQLKERW